jgi:hypothetical protein
MIEIFVKSINPLNFFKILVIFLGKKEKKIAKIYVLVKI